MGRGKDLDRELERLLDSADRVGVPRPAEQRATLGIPPPVPAPAATARPLTPTDTAAQIVESASQILTMIGANPRAIRPILAQRRLTKEAILEAAASVRARAQVVLAEMDTLIAARRAAADEAAAGLRAQIAAENEEAASVARAEDIILTECESVRARVGRVQARFAIAALPHSTPEPRGLFARLIDDISDSRVVGAFVRVNRAAAVAAPAIPDGRILRTDHPAVISVQNMDEFVQATDQTTAHADLYHMWCRSMGTTDADVRGTLAEVERLVAEQVAQSSEVKRQNDAAHSTEIARLQGGLESVTNGIAKQEAEQRSQRSYLISLAERAAKVEEVYTTL